MPPDNSPLFASAEFAQFYDLENRWAADFSFCTGLARAAATVLDLGCGTGELAVALSRTCDVTGVDPADAMLTLARARDTERAVSWINADARKLRLDRRLDLIVMTGHSFQVFLSDADQHAVLKTIAAHLTQRGRFIFDMRNRDCRAWQGWRADKTRRRLSHPGLGQIEAWTEAEFDEASSVLAYTTTYRTRATGHSTATTAHIRFCTKDQIALALQKAGLVAGRWLGDWRGSDWHPGSAEIIPLGRLK
ncbi:MAG: trans-aconitate 2-methyltransferase [Paracoccaceae bacterium]